MSVALSSRRSLGNTSLIGGAEDSKPANKPKTKRYSTAFGTVATSPQSKDERKKQQDVAELYQGVVKRVQENKMTAKNAFMSRMFIDDLDVVLVQAKGSFHKASCAVSTAAEVYCLLVDDLSQSTTMVQELLFNNSSAGVNATRGETDGEEARANRKRALGNGTAEGGVSSTLETNLSNIRSESVEAELEIDAQFQKLLQGKDTGAAGMLLNILKVYNGPNLALDSACIPAFSSSAQGEEAAKPKERLEVPKELVGKLCKAAAPSFHVGRAFAELRREADKSSNAPTKTVSVVETLDPRSSFGSTMSSSAYHSGEQEEAPVIEDYDYDAGGGGGFDDDDNDDDGGYEFGGDEYVPEQQQPTAVPFIMRAFDAQAMETETGKLDTFVIPSNVLVEFHQEQQQKQPAGKVWLGFAHWKAPRVPSDSSATGASGEAPIVKRQKKQAKKIDFCKLAAVNEKVAFAKPTSARLIQLPKSTPKSDHLLPVNTHFHISDLQQFFLRPNQTLRGNLNSAAATATVQDDGDYYGGGDYYGDDDNGGGDADDDYDDENDFFDREQLNLVAPAHHVERIRVAYATRAKKVDVKQLKVDLWDTIDTLNPDVEEVIEISDNEGAEEEAKVSLTGSIRITQEQNPHASEEEVITVPFYFICMLHLANEKGLELHSSQELDDISIFRSPSSSAC